MKIRHNQSIQGTPGKRRFLRRSPVPVVPDLLRSAKEMDRDTKESPWAAWGESAKFEDCIIGNRAGLEALRDKISEALQKGAAQLPEKITTCTRVVVVEAPANPEWIPEKHGRLKNAVGLTGCAIIAVAVAAIFIVGLGTIKDWWK